MAYSIPVYSIYNILKKCIYIYISHASGQDALGRLAAERSGAI